jgi:hypothetical protein
MSMGFLIGAVYISQVLAQIGAQQYGSRMYYRNVLCRIYRLCAGFDLVDRPCRTEADIYFWPSHHCFLYRRICLSRGWVLLRLCISRPVRISVGAIGAAP